MVSEGTYPYNFGGVSTWAHDLCTKVGNVDFTLYSINAEVEEIPKYPLGENIKRIVQVPMWSAEEPIDCVDYNKEYSSILASREITTEDWIATSFVPNFEKFVKLIFSKDHDMEVLNSSMFNMWQFFQTYDYKKTMSSMAVWNVFNKVIEEMLTQEEQQQIAMVDVTTAMRWIYRFLIPIAIDVPKSDISHITISGIAVLPALALKYKYNTPILITEHGVFIRERMIAISTSNYSFFLKKMLIHFSECITKLAYHHASKITTVSKFNMSWETFYGAESHNIQVVYNGVDTTLFRPASKPQHLKGIPTVVAAARIFDLKDIETMIRTCKEVSAMLPNVQFLVYGNKDAVPEYTAKCEDLISELSLEDNFFLKGFHAHPEQIYHEGDISILTSISEGFPFTVIESMSCGIPVISTDVGGVSEALDSTCGVICKPRDHKALAEQVVRLLQDEGMRVKMGENARKKVEKYFTISNFVQTFEEVYASIAFRSLEKKEIA
jgi:glycosyltransferase involved in cell wall biosynthesis